MEKITNLEQESSFNVDELRKDIGSGKRALRITTHAQIEAFKSQTVISITFPETQALAA